MFPLTKEILTYVLIGLSSILVVLVVLILRKRGMLGGKRWDEAPRPAPEETGPTDHGAIKEKLKSDKGADVPRPPEAAQAAEEPSQDIPEEDVPRPKEPARKMRFPFGRKDDDENPFPVEPGDEEGLEKETPGGEAEEGIDLEDEEDAGHAKETQDRTQRIASARTQTESDSRSVGFADLNDNPGERPQKQGMKEDDRAILMRKFARAVPVKGRDGDVVPKPAAPEVRKAEKDAKPAPAPRHDEATNAPKAEPMSTADIMKSPQGFKGHTVSLEGELKLSSRGAEDAWYILFDGRGSVVVRSKEQIDSRRAKILAKVEQTRLGQVYLDVISYEKA